MLKIKKNFISESFSIFFNFPLNKKRCNTKFVPPRSIKITDVIFIANPFTGQPVIELYQPSFIISGIPPSLVEKPPVAIAAIAWLMASNGSIPPINQ